jgi:hypothetical protein
LNKGHSSGLSADQRGFTRPVGTVGVTGGDGGDIGAFEVGSTPVTMRITSISRGGSGSVVLEASGVPYGVHRIQASAGITVGSFVDVATLTADAAGVLHYQENVTGLRRFYRVAFP